MTKAIIFDSGPLINFAMNGSLHILESLKKEFKGDFLITKEVMREIIERPSQIKKFELEALQLKDLFDRKIIKLADLTSSQVDKLRKKRDELINIANSTFKSKKRNIHLIDKGEAAALALSSILKSENRIVVDERTTRMLVENPENLRRLLEKKLKTKIQANEKNYPCFKEYKIIRSTELAYIAYKKGLFKLKYSNVLEAMLYGLKYRGCSISEAEIQEMSNL